jgi:prepilin peptidase CpaA
VAGLFSVLAVALFVAAAGFDLASRRIPNALVVALLVLGLGRIAWGLLVGGSPVTPGTDVAAALAIFCGGALFFHLSLIGGGDVKLLAAGALWLGAAAVWPYLFVTALAGGALAVVFLVREALARAPRQNRASLPYGVAIAAGGILVTATGL